MPEASLTINGTRYPFSFPDDSPDPVGAMDAANKAIIAQVDERGLPEVFSPSLGQRVGEMDPSRRLKTAAAIPFANHPAEQLALVRENYGEDLHSFDFDGESGALKIQLVGERDEAGNPISFTRGFIDAPGFSTFDVVSLGLEMLPALGFATLPAKLALQTRGLNLLLRSTASAGVGGAYEFSRQKLVDGLLEHETVEQAEADLGVETFHGLTSIMIAMGAGAGGELLGATVSGLHKIFRNSRLTDGNKLNDRGRAAIQRMGIDPNLVDFPDIVDTFKKSPGFANRAFTEAFMREHPDLIARLAIEGAGSTAQANGMAVRPALTKLADNVQDLTIRSKDMYQQGVKWDPRLKSEFAGMLVAEARESMRAVSRNTPKVREFGQKLENIMSAATRPAPGQKAEDAFTAVARYSDWRATALANSSADTHADVAVREMVTATDKIMNQFLIDGVSVGVERGTKLEARTVNKVLKNLGDFYNIRKELTQNVTGADLLDNIFVNQRDGVDAMNTIFRTFNTKGDVAAVDALLTVRHILGPQSREFLGMKAEMVRILGDQGDLPFNNAKFRENLRNFMQNNSPIADIIFDSEERKILANLAQDPTKKSLETVVGSLLEIRYGLRGSILTGAIRRLGNVPSRFSFGPSRPLFSKYAVAATIAESENVPRALSKAEEGIAFTAEMINNIYNELTGGDAGKETGESGFEDVQRF